jgi:hypothetical protein
MITDMAIIKKHLIDHVEIELPYPLEKDIMIKYITMKDGEQSFYTGGRFINMLNEKIILSNAGRSWAVPTVIKDKKGNVIYESRFFVHKDFNKEKDKDTTELESIISSQQEIIKKLSQQVKLKAEENDKLKIIIHKMRG